MTRATNRSGARKGASGHTTQKREPTPDPSREDSQEGPATSMSGAITAYNFRENEIRTIFRDGAVWFVAIDVCKVLEIANSRDALSRLDDDERGFAGLEFSNFKWRLATINESGLFALILTSRKPEAKAFRRWITGEVIPSIRRTGSYQAPEPNAPATNDADIRVRANDYGVHVVLVAPDMHSVRKVDFDRLMIEGNVLQSELMACSLISAARLLDMITLRGSVALDGGTAEDALRPTIKQGAETARRFLQSIWAQQQDGMIAPASTSQ